MMRLTPIAGFVLVLALLLELLSASIASGQTVAQGAAGTRPWVINWTQISGATPSATNPVPARITDGAVFIDPRSIRVLTSGDTVTAVQPVGSNFHVVVDAGSAVLGHVITDATSVSTVTNAVQPAAVATWTSATAQNTAITISLVGMSSNLLTIRKTGTITAGQATLEYTNDGTNYYTILSPQVRLLQGGLFANPIDLTGAGIFPAVWQFDGSAWTTVRLRLSTAITNTGSVTVQLDSSAATASTPTGQVTVTGTIQQGNSNQSILQSWYTKLSDGTTGPVAVKAASTLPALTDIALVTTQRDPLPAGTNVLGHVIADTGSTTAVTQATAANLNATVVGTGTFAAQVTGTVTANAGTNLNTSLLALEAGGNLAQIVTNTKQRGSSAAPVMIQATDMDTPLLAANTSRVSWQVCNQSGSPLLLKFGSGATPFSYNVRVASGACYSDTAYMGVVNGAWFIGADRYAMVSETF